MLSDKFSKNIQKWFQRPPMEQNIKRNTAVVIACGAAMVFISMGTRQSFGLFLQPVALDLAVGREVFSLAIALQNLLFGLPLIGILAEWFGSWLFSWGSSHRSFTCRFLMNQLKKFRAPISDRSFFPFQSLFDSVRK